jgi:hypothetical protein
LLVHRSMFDNEGAKLELTILKSWRFGIDHGQPREISWIQRQ